MKIYKIFVYLLTFLWILFAIVFPELLYRNLRLHFWGPEYVIIVFGFVFVSYWIPEKIIRIIIYTVCYYKSKSLKDIFAIMTVEPLLHMELNGRGMPSQRVMTSQVQRANLRWKAMIFGLILIGLAVFSSNYLE